MEETAADLILLYHCHDCLFLVDGRLSSATALRVGGEGSLEFMGKPQVVHYKSARFVAEDAIDPRNRLH